MNKLDLKKIAFCDAILDKFFDNDFYDIDGADVQDIAERCGVLEEVDYEPDIHGDRPMEFDIMPGDALFVRAVDDGILNTSDTQVSALIEAVSGALAVESGKAIASIEPKYRRRFQQRFDSTVLAWRRHFEQARTPACSTLDLSERRQ